MSQLQEDPANTATDCYDRTAALNAQILILSDVELYILDNVDSDKLV